MVIVLIGVTVIVFGAVWFGTQAVVNVLVVRRAAARVRVSSPVVDHTGPIIRWGLVISGRSAPWIDRILPDRWRTSLTRALCLADLDQCCSAAQWCALVGCLALSVGVMSGWLVPVHRVLWGLGGGISGALIPVFWLLRSRRRRCEQIERALPGAIQLMALAVEAGHEFIGALAHIVERSAPDTLRAEWQRLLQAMRVGLPRAAALRQMQQRVGLTSVSAVTNALIYADRLGTPLADLLHTYAEQLRFERFQRAERMGALASQQILLPIVCCILPAFLLLLLGGVLVGLASEGGNGWIGLP